MEEALRGGALKRQSGWRANNSVCCMRQRRHLILKIFSGLFCLLLLLSLAGLIFPRQILTVDSGPVKADALVVLGGGVHERPERAAELFKEGAAPRVICSGSGDCDSNRQLLIRAGVPAAAV